MSAEEPENKDNVPKPNKSQTSSLSADNKEEELTTNLPNITIDPLDGLQQLCDQFASLIVPYSETEQATIQATILNSNSNINTDTNTDPNTNKDETESKQNEIENENNDNEDTTNISNKKSSSLHNSTNNTNTTDTTNNTTNTNISDDATKSVSPTPRLMGGIPYNSETLKPGEKNVTQQQQNGNNSTLLDDENDGGLHPTISLINNMNQLVQILSNTLDETVIRLEELQSIGLDQLQPAITECGNKAVEENSNDMMEESNILQKKYEEIQQCFEQIDTIESMIATIDLNLCQHEWRFNKLRALYVEELGLPPQAINAMNDQIATMEEFEYISQSASNIQKRINNFGDWVTKSVKDKTLQIATKSKDVPKSLSNTVRHSFTSLFGSKQGGKQYDGYAEAKETITDNNGNDSIDNNNNNNIVSNGMSGAQKESNVNENNSNVEEDENDANKKTWPLKPEEIKAREKRGRHPFGGFGSSLRNVTFSGAMGKLRENISKNVTNIAKKKPTATTDETAANETKESKEDDSGMVPTPQGSEQQQQQPFNIRNVFKIRDKRYPNEIEGDKELLNWKPEKLPDIETLLSSRNLFPIDSNNNNNNNNASANGNDSKNVSQAKKDSVGSDSSGGHQLP